MCSLPRVHSLPAQKGAICLATQINDSVFETRFSAVLCYLSAMKSWRSVNFLFFYRFFGGHFLFNIYLCFWIEFFSFQKPLRLVSSETIAQERDVNENTHFSVLNLMI